MPAYKRISDAYTITAPLVTINGNLVVTGNTASISATNTDITDNVIVLNKGETGPGVTAVYSGINIDRGSGQFVPGLRWDESVSAFKISNDGSTWEYIATSSGGGMGLSSISEDTTPALGGNLDVGTHQIYSSSTDVVVFKDNVAIATTTVAPTAITNNVIVYSSTVAGGGSGLFVVNTDTAGQELVTKSKAIVYGLIF